MTLRIKAKDAQAFFDQIKRPMPAELQEAIASVPQKAARVEKGRAPVYQARRHVAETSPAAEIGGFVIYLGVSAAVAFILGAVVLKLAISIVF